MQNKCSSTPLRPCGLMRLASLPPRPQRNTFVSWTTPLIRRHLCHSPHARTHARSLWSLDPLLLPFSSIPNPTLAPSDHLTYLKYPVWAVLCWGFCLIAIFCETWWRFKGEGGRGPTFGRNGEEVMVSKLSCRKPGCHSWNIVKMEFIF